MEQQPNVQSKTPERFSTPEEEIAYLRQRIEQKEQELSAERGVPPSPEDAASEAVKEYKHRHTQEVLDEEYRTSEVEEDQIVLDLEPEEHDTVMNELLGLMHEKGVKTALNIVQKQHSSHIEDDFHRFLVQYLAAGYPIAGLNEGSDTYRALEKTLFEVILPPAEEGSKERELKTLISGMEQVYAGLLSGLKSEHITIELAVEHVGEEVSFFVSVPDRRRELFEKHVVSIFPRAKIYERKNDYNIFNDGGVSLGSYATSADNPIYPLKMYDEFDHDPLTVILNAFSKMAHSGEGAAIQLVLKPTDKMYDRKYRHAIKQIEDGVSIGKATDIAENVGQELWQTAKEIFSSSGKKDKGGDAPDPNTKETQRQAIEMIQKKVSSPISPVNIRIVTSAPDERRAEDLLSVLESAFSQFENTHGNALRFNRVGSRKRARFFHNFSFRLYRSRERIPLSIQELTTLIHFPVRDVEASREVKQAKAGTAPAPVNVPTEGILMGTNVHRGKETPIYMKPEDRLRHLYTIGQTGTGKTTLLTNLITQDIQNGDGCCLIDPHGSDVQHLLSVIPPERYDDVIYFDPAYTPRAMGLNMLQYDRRYPEQKTFVVNEMLGIFNKLFDMKVAGGPMFEQYFRNATMLVLEDPESGNTLLEISRVLADENFRKLKLSRCNNPVVKQYWEEVAQKAGGEASLENIVPYITSKFDVFLSNDIMRPIIAQEQSAFDFRRVMDEQKILLVNLSKGRLGDINANLIGLILVGKILMAALSRVDAPEEKRPPFYLYIDEFQNVTTDSISTILSEARKYKLSLNIAHQFIAQLEDNIRDAVFGNVGSMAVYRVSSEDAETLESRFEPTFSAKDIAEQDNFNYYAKFLFDGIPAKPFSVKALPPVEGDSEQVEKLKELSYLKFGRPREEVEAEIQRRYQIGKQNKT